MLIEDLLHLRDFDTQFTPEDCYYVEMTNGFKAIVLQVEKDGKVNYWARVH